MKKMLPKIFLSFLFAFGAANSAIAQYAEDEIVIWSWDPNFNIPIMEEAIRRYKTKNPKPKFNIVDFSADDVRQKLQISLMAGAEKSLPDIVLINDLTAQKFLVSFKKYFMPLSNEIDFSVFSQSKVLPLTLGNTVYGVPFDSGVTGLFYRRDYLEKAGISPSELDNITWDKLIEIGKKLKKKTGKHMLAIDYSDPLIFHIMMVSSGAWYFDENGKLLLSKSQPLKATLETVRKIYKSGIAKNVSGWANYVAAHASGDVATVISGVWIISSIKAQQDQHGKWGLAPTPRLSGVEGAMNVSNAMGSNWFVLNHSKNKATIIDFFKEIYVKDIDFYDHILRKYGAIGSLNSLVKSDEFNKPDKFFNNQKIWAYFASSLPKVPAINYGLFTEEVSSTIIANLPALFSGNKTVDEIAKTIEDQTSHQIGY